MASRDGKPQADTRRARRWLRRLAWSLLGFYLVYLIGANFVLNTGVLGPVISKKPEKLRVEWGSGWTVVPGFAHIKDLRIQGQSKKVQWQCRLGHGAFRISLLNLPRKIVRIRSGTGGDFSFYIRKRVATAEEWAAIESMVPEIEAFSNPPDPAPEDIYPPPKPRRKNPWEIHVSDVVLENQIDLWIGRLRIHGKGRIGGGADVELRGGPIGIPEVFFDLEEARIVIGGNVLARDFPLQVTNASLTPFPSKGTDGLAILGHFRGNVKISDGKLDDLGVIRSLLPEGGGFEMVGGEGRLNVDLVTPERGHSSGTVSIDLTQVELRVKDRPLSGDVLVELALEEGDHLTGDYTLGESLVSFENMLMPKPKKKQHESDPTPEEFHDPWWGRITLGEGEIVVGKPLMVDAVAKIEMKDTRPLLATFLAKPTKDGEGTKLPVWARAVPDIRHVEGTAHVRQDGEGLRIDDVEIYGDKLEMLARIHLAGGEVNGQIFVGYKALNVGIDLHEGKKSIKLKKPKEWYVWKSEGLD